MLLLLVRACSDLLSRSLGTVQFNTHAEPKDFTHIGQEGKRSTNKHLPKIFSNAA
jgi:hypothetical protein